MKIEITKRFIYNFKWVEVGTVMEHENIIPKEVYKEVIETVKEKSKKDKKGFDEYD